MATTRVVFAYLMLCFFTYCLSKSIPDNPDVTPLFQSPHCSVQPHPDCTKDIKPQFLAGFCTVFYNYSLGYCRKTGIPFKDLPPQSENIYDLCDEIIKLQKLNDSKSIPVVKTIFVDVPVCVELCTKLEKLCVSWKNLGNALKLLTIPIQPGSKESKTTDSRTPQYTKTPVTVVSTSSIKLVDPNSKNNSSLSNGKMSTTQAIDVTKSKTGYSSTPQDTSKMTTKINTTSHNNDLKSGIVSQSMITNSQSKSKIGEEDVVIDSTKTAGFKPELPITPYVHPIFGKEPITDTKNGHLITPDENAARGAGGSDLRTPVSTNGRQNVNQKTNNDGSKDRSLQNKVTTGGVGVTKNGVPALVGGQSFNTNKPIDDGSRNGIVTANNMPSLQNQPQTGGVVAPNRGMSGSPEGSRNGIVPANNMPSLQNQPQTGGVVAPNRGMSGSPEGSRNGIVPANNMPSLQNQPQTGGVVTPNREMSGSPEGSRNGIVPANNMPSLQNQPQTGGVVTPNRGMSGSPEGSRNGIVPGNNMPSIQNQPQAGGVVTPNRGMSGSPEGSRNGIVPTNNIPSLQNQPQAGGVVAPNRGMSGSPEGSRNGIVTANNMPSLQNQPQTGGVVAPNRGMSGSPEGSRNGIVPANNMPSLQNQPQTGGVVTPNREMSGSPEGSRNGIVPGNNIPSLQNQPQTGGVVAPNRGMSGSPEGSRNGIVPANRIPSLKTGFPNYGAKPNENNYPTGNVNTDTRHEDNLNNFDTAQGAYGGVRNHNSKQEKSLISSEYNETPSSAHFMGYFLTAIVLCIAGYVVFHNKQKIFAFIIEGRNQRRSRRPNSGEYKKLQTNVDDVMTSLEKTTTSKNYIY